MLYTRFYDQVLTEINAGKVHEGINQLVGMLDVVGLGSGSLAQAKRELRGHSLCQMLLEDPSVAAAEARPNEPDARVRMIGGTAPSDDISSTGRRLFEVTSDLTFARALRQRRESFDLRLSNAWRQGQKICVLASDGCSLVRQLRGADSSNITIIDIEEASDAICLAAQTSPFFDLILAPDLLDRDATPALSEILRPMAACLGAHGSIVVAALMPQHLGAGWRSACLNWDPYCHDEGALAKLAASAGLTARTYRDETDCIVWCELKVPPRAHDKGAI